MKAVICKSYGSPEILQVQEIEIPVPDDNEIQVKIHAVTVNRTDCAMLKGTPFFMKLATGLLKPKRDVLGGEFAGEVSAVGKNICSFKVGDRVYGINEDSFGAHAQYMVIEDKTVTSIPEGISYEQAAASCEGSFYAYNFINKVNLKSGDSVLVNGASGGIGSAAVQQLCSYEGVHITAVCGTENMELIKSLGAHRVIDYRKDDFTKEDVKYDYVFDTVGKSSFLKCRSVLKEKGVYISSELGALYQNLWFSLLTPIFKNRCVKFPVPENCKESILFTKRLMEEGKYRAVIDKIYPLEEIVHAFSYVNSGVKTGNVVITVDHDDD